jgi:predicted metal-dependent HD superfamily phosphohydrolase
MRRLSLYAGLVTVLMLFSVSTVLAKSNSPMDSTAKEAGKEFKRIIKDRTKNSRIADTLWAEAVELYSGPTRFYHNREHLTNFYAQLGKARKAIKDWDALVIAMVYHDIIYGSEDHRDEERSAELAVKRLTEAGFDGEFIGKVDALIRATKAHALSEDNDTNLFNDADMSIVGLDRAYYQRYVQNVRKEYANSPNFDAGRKRVLQYFLNMPRIFKTDLFHQLYEASARENIQWEISTLP